MLASGTPLGNNADLSHFCGVCGRSSEPGESSGNPNVRMSFCSARGRSRTPVRRLRSVSAPTDVVCHVGWAMRLSGRDAATSGLLQRSATGKADGDMSRSLLQARDVTAAARFVFAATSKRAANSGVANIGSRTSNPRRISARLARKRALARARTRRGSGVRTRQSGPARHPGSQNQCRRPGVLLRLPATLQSRM